ncbi:hypothetical protein [Streptomyces albipurpureus]|uniref:Uncharacterized protein n=1 Tax=Streptomyces albipurpureus TaxID=2897419 RepID=A0ABT0UVQ0_9ACTN|nr:hypothetical protein [Streptomyces sp. CWNU-1]MCM2392653.1 hypothetical protein [Streptomyces sp. CWNU-1]
MKMTIALIPRSATNYGRVGPGCSWRGNVRPTSAAADRLADGNAYDVEVAAILERYCVAPAVAELRPERDTLQESAASPRPLALPFSSPAFTEMPLTVPDPPRLPPYEGPVVVLAFRVKLRTIL